MGHRGKDSSLTMTAIIRSAWPRHAAKHIEAELGCSRRQAWRMIETGRVPRSLNARLLRAVEFALSRQSEELGKIRHVLRIRELADVAPQTAGQTDRTYHAADSKGEGQAAGPELPFLKSKPAE